MATATEKLNILVIQHLEHIGVGDDIIAQLKPALEGKEAKGSTLFDVFCSATGEGAPAPAAGKKQPARMSQGAAPAQQQQQRQAAAPVMREPVPEAKPVIAKEPDVRNPKLDSDLMKAVRDGAVDSIPSIINAGAYVNMQDGAGTSPLLAATEADKADVCKVLLQNNADVNLARPDGTSPLLCAYKGNKKKVLKELTAGAFRTLNSAVHQHGSIGGNFMYDPGQDEGITAMDMLQLQDETNKLFKLQAHPPEVQSPQAVTKEKSMVAIGGDAETPSLAAGSVRLLMQELVHASQKPTAT